MNVLYFLCRLSRRLPVRARIILYYLLLFVYPLKAKKQHNPQAFLLNYKQDAGESCIVDNDVLDTPKYDLMIVVPIYNVQKFLVECMDSILNQETQFSFYVVAVNDGSTDGSCDILNRYQSYDNVKIINQTNKGISGARNSALHIIDAKYVMFVDSDDILAQGAIEKLMSYSVQTDADIIQGAYDVFGDNGKNIRCVEKRGYCKAQCLNGFPWGKVYKAYLWKKISFPEEYDFEDTLNRLITFNIAKSAYICEDIVYHYRFNESGVTRSMVGNYKLIDTVWVTLSLHKDASRLNLDSSEEYSEALINQLMFNMVRVASLKNHTINQAIFDLYRESVDYSKLERPISKLACQALGYLKNNNFNKFYLSSILLK